MKKELNYFTKAIFHASLAEKYVAYSTSRIQCDLKIVDECLILVHDSLHTPELPRICCWSLIGVFPLNSTRKGFGVRGPNRKSHIAELGAVLL